MGMPDSSDIEAAILAKLSSDATLMALMPNLAYIDEAPPGSKQFVIVSLVDEVDEGRFGGRAYEDALYLIEARELSTVTTHNIKAAAARIDVLLEDQSLTVSGYTWMTMHREARIRITEVDAVDLSLRWQRRGGHYRVQMAIA